MANGNSNPHVLICEDSPADRAELQDFILSLGARVDVATRLSEALRMVLARHYDALILEICQKGMDPRSALPAIREVSPTTPVIVLTRNRTDNGDDFARIGARAFLLKPVSRQTLYEVFQNIFGDSR